MALSARQMVITISIYSFAVTGIVILIFFGHSKTNEYKSRTVVDRKEELYAYRSFASDIDLAQPTLAWNSDSTSSEERFPGTEPSTWRGNTTSIEETQTGTESLIWNSSITYGTRALIWNSTTSGKETEEATSVVSTPRMKPQNNFGKLSYVHPVDCPEMSPMIKGRLNIDANFVPSEQQAIENAGPHISAGGCYNPTHCKFDQNVAIIIPYKNREKHLYTLLYHLHPMLQRQWVRYCVFVAEQYDDGAFNKARIMNAAFLEIYKHPKKFNCLIFHDVDMLPEDDRNTYKCAEMIKHLSPALDKFKYKVNYGTHFGGVGAIRTEHYKAINGHSNRFYGWGGEDSDIELRFKIHKLTTVWNADYGRYKMIPHDHPWYFNPSTGSGSYMVRIGNRKYEENRIFLKESDPSGVNTTKYSVANTTVHRLYTKMTLDIRTILVNEASVKFVNHTDSAGVENPWFTNKRLNSTFLENKIRGYGISAGEQIPNTECYYRRFAGKTVNKTVAQKKKEIFTNLQTAQARCTERSLYCQSIVELFPGIFELRTTGFMHETELRYKFGRFKHSIVTETHKDVSVYVKICPKDARYQQYIESPVRIYGPLDGGPSPQHRVDLDLQLYKAENIALNYTIKVYTAHKAALKELEFSKNKSLDIYDSLCLTYTNSVIIANLSDKDSMKPFLPEGIDDLEKLPGEDLVLHLQSPPVEVPRMPGCYICTSTITDQTGVKHLSWKWWYEVRGSTDDLEKSLLEKQLVGEVRSTELTEGRNRYLGELDRKKKEELIAEVRAMGISIPKT